MRVLLPLYLAAILTAAVTNIDILNVDETDINIGDYLLIDQEIVRVKTTVSVILLLSSVVSLEREQLHTQSIL